MKKFPIDTVSIPCDRSDEWYNDFSLPQTPENFYSFYSDIKETYFETVKKYYGTFIGDVLLTKIKIYQEYTKVICAINLIKISRDNGLQPLCSEKAILINKLLKNDLGFSNSLNFTEFKESDKFHTVYKKFRNIIYSMRVNKDPLYFLNAKKNDMTVLNVAPSKETMMYADKINSSFIYASPLDWLLSADKIRIDSTLSDEIHAISAEIAENIRKKLSEKYKFTVDENIITILKKFTVMHLTSGARDLTVINNSVSECKPMLLLGGNQSSFFNRAMALCNRKIGGKSIGFNHGNDTFSNRDIRFELSIVNEFVTYTEGGAHLIRERDKSFFPSFSPNEPHISSLNTDIYLNLWKKYKDIPVPPKISRIMVLGYPYDLSEILTYGPPDVAFLHLEMKVIKALTDGGFDVICKSHPESCINTDSFYGNNVIVTREPFEDLMEYADAFVFLYSYTSVFPIGLCTNKPAVLLNTLKNHRHHTKEVYDLLGKRCKVIDVYNDPLNRFDFNKEELLEYLGRKHSKPNTELLERFMFPEGYKEI